MMMSNMSRSLKLVAPSLLPGILLVSNLEGVLRSHFTSKRTSWNIWRRGGSRILLRSTLNSSATLSTSGLRKQLRKKSVMMKMMSLRKKRRVMWKMLTRRRTRTRRKRRRSWRFLTSGSSSTNKSQSGCESRRRLQRKNMLPFTRA